MLPGASHEIHVYLVDSRYGSLTRVWSDTNYSHLSCISVDIPSAERGDS